MGNKELFKTVLFGGFQKEEVWNYMQEVEAEIEGGRQVAERAQQEYAQQLEEENLMRQKLSQQLSDEQERTAKLEEEKTAMESELGALQAEAESLRAEKAELQTGLDKLQEEKSGLEATVETINTEKAGQQAEMEALQKAKDELQARAESLQTEKEEALEGLENLRTEQTKIQAEAESLRAEKAELQTGLNKLQEEKSGLEAAVETLNTEKTGQQAEVEALQKAKDELQARTDVLEAEKEKALAELESLRNEKVKLETEAEKLRAEQQKLKAETDDLSVQLETQQLALAKEKEHTAARLAEWKSREDSLKTELKRKKAEAQTIFQKQQQEIRQLKQQLAALKADHARSAGQSSLDGLKNGLGQMLFKVTGNAGRNSAGKRSEGMRQWDADSYSEERTQWGYAENPSRAEKPQKQAEDYREKSQENVKTDYMSQRNDAAATEQGTPAAGQNMTATAAVHPAPDTISDVALDTASDTVPAPNTPDENNLTDTVNKTTDDAIAEVTKACEDMQAAQEAKTQDSENADAQQKQQEKDTYYKEHVDTVNETIARAQERIAKMLQELQAEVE